MTSNQFAHQHKGLVRLPEVTDAFQINGLFNFEQRPVSTVESRIVGDLPTKTLPCTLKIGQDVFFKAGVVVHRVFMPARQVVAF